ncbi:MAG: DUF1501 domain-containing protein [Puniceicoccales bacterium]
MHNQRTFRAVTRREFLKDSVSGLGLVAFSGFAPAFLTSTAKAGVGAPETGRPILVLIQLAGGNDGLNTCIPFQDDAYYNLRPDLAIRKGSLQLTDNLALHPSCAGMERLWKDGQMSIIQNVGYPNPNRSHFRSTEIWETATDSDTIGTTGWLGRYFDNACDGAGHTDPLALHLGDEAPGHFISNEQHSIFGLPARGKLRQRDKDELSLLDKLTQAPTDTQTGDYLQHMVMDSIVTEKRVQQIVDRYRPMTAYARNSFSQSLQRVAAMIAAGMETRVYYVSQGGYDTHANQLNSHANRLNELSTGLQALQNDLAKHKLDNQVLSVVFSEFGRRPKQNASQGTDHGAAAPLFMLGGNLSTNLLGNQPNLVDLHNADLKHEFDFRQVYASILRDWFQADPSLVLDGHFAPLPILRPA